MKLNPIVWQHGAASGLFIVIILLVAYIMGIEVMISSWVTWSTNLLVLAAMVLTDITVRKEEGGLTFRSGFMHAWAAGVLATSMGVLFNLILQNVVDPELAGKLLDVTYEKIMQEGGAMLSQLPETTVVEMKEQMRWWMGSAGQLTGWVIGGLFWALPALIVAAILKKVPNDSIQ